MLGDLTPLLRVVQERDRSPEATHMLGSIPPPWTDIHKGDESYSLHQIVPKETGVESTHMLMSSTTFGQDQKLNNLAVDDAIIGIPK